MAKDLPYFKFYSSEWNDGDITLEDMKTQGLFINICSYYWSQECQVSHVKLQKRFKNYTKQLHTLFLSEIIHEDGDNVKIKFLDKQYEEREVVKHRNKANGLKGGRPKKTHSVNSGLEVANQNITNKEERKEEEKRKNITEEPLTVSISIDPLTTTRPKPDAWSKFCETYPKPFNPMCSFTRSAFHEAVSIADGGDVILVATSMYSDYFTKTNEPLQYASSAQKWLESQSWRTDWNAEAVKKKSSGKKGMSNSKPSAIKAGDVF